MRVVQFGLGTKGLAMASTPLDTGVNRVATDTVESARGAFADVGNGDLDYSALYLTIRSGESA